MTDAKPTDEPKGADLFYDWEHHVGGPAESTLWIWQRGHAAGVSSQAARIEELEKERASWRRVSERLEAERDTLTRELAEAKAKAFEQGRCEGAKEHHAQWIEMATEVSRAKVALAELKNELSEDCARTFDNWQQAGAEVRRLTNVLHERDKELAEAREGLDKLYSAIERTGHGRVNIPWNEIHDMLDAHRSARTSNTKGGDAMQPTYDQIAERRRVTAGGWEGAVSIIRQHAAELHESLLHQEAHEFELVANWLEGAPDDGPPRVGDLAAIREALADITGAVGANFVDCPEAVQDAWGPCDHLMASIGWPDDDRRAGQPEAKSDELRPGDKGYQYSPPYTNLRPFDDIPGSENPVQRPGPYYSDGDPNTDRIADHERRLARIESWMVGDTQNLLAEIRTERAARKGER